MDVLGELSLGVRQFDAVLRTLRTGDRRNDRRQVEFEVLGVLDFVRRVVPQALFLGVLFDQLNLLVRTAGELEVVDGDVVDGEHGGGRTEFGAHVADRGAVGQRNGSNAFAVELNELADNTVLAEHVGDRQNDVGSGHAGGDFALELKADDARNEHGDGLAEHCCFCFDAAHAPAEHTEAVDHGGVGVGADEGVGVSAGHAADFAGHDDTCQVFDVDLVDDAHARGNDLEVVECGLAPAQELVALTVALVFDVHVALDGVCVAEGVNLDRVVDDEFSGSQRVDVVRVTAEFLNGFAHGGEVDDAGNTGEVLHDDTSRRELDFNARFGLGVPRGECLDVVLGDVGTVFGAEQVLQQDLEAERKLVRTIDRAEAVDLVGLVSDLKSALGLETVDVAQVTLLFVRSRYPAPGSASSELELGNKNVVQSILTSR